VHAAIEKGPKRIGGLDPFGSDAILGPGHVFDGVRRLHRRDDAQFGEPGHVGGTDDLRVFDARTCVT
jgi:hypothetical protein